MNFVHRLLLALRTAILFVFVLKANSLSGMQLDGAAELRVEFEQLAEFLNSPEYEVAWPEHIVLCYWLAKHRDPEAWEFHSLLSLARDPHLHFEPSQALVHALSKNGIGFDCADLDAFLAHTSEEDFRTYPEATAFARQLASIPAPEVFAQLEARAYRRRAHRAGIPRSLPIEPVAQATQASYSIYYGYIHAHTDLSDGEGSALEAYQTARDVAGLDFLGVTDHGELLVDPFEDKYGTLKQAADATYQPGHFVSLWGFEWSSLHQGHVNVLMSDDFTNAIADVDIQDLYDWVADRPQTVAIFNHPGRESLLSLTEFRLLAPYPGLERQFIGIETWNRSDGFDTYFSDCDWFLCQGRTYLDEGNRANKWYLGPLGGQDNHSRQWGTLNDFRVAVLAPKLTRASLLNALRRRRFYATLDANLQIDVRSQGLPMGSVLDSNQKREFLVRAGDTSGDSITNVDLYRNGDKLQSQSAQSHRIKLRFEDPGRVQKGDYYYFLFTQSDGDQAVTASFWFL